MPFRSSPGRPLLTRWRASAPPPRLALLRELRGPDHSGRPGADDRPPLPGGRRRWRHREAFALPLVVGDKGLQPADGHGDVLFAHPAVALALELLRAEAPAHLGHGARLSG